VGFGEARPARPRPNWLGPLHSRDHYNADDQDLIEDWIEMRATLKRQLEMLKSGQMHTGTDLPNTTTKAAITRVEACIGELNALLKEYSHAQRP